MGWFTRFFRPGTTSAETLATDGTETRIDVRATQARAIGPSSPLPPSYRYDETFPQTQPIGYAGARCASCHGELPKKPGAKAKCPLCGEYNFIRTRAHDRAQVVVTAAQAHEIARQWAELDGYLDEFDSAHAKAEARKNRVRSELEEKFGRSPGENDVKWAMLNEDILHDAQAGRSADRDTYWQMYSILRKEKSYAEAAAFLMVVCVMDLNEEHTGGVGSLLPGIVGRLETCLDQANLLQDEIRKKELFDRLAAKVQVKKRRVSMDTAWAEIAKALKQ